MAPLPVLLVETNGTTRESLLRLLFHPQFHIYPGEVGELTKLLKSCDPAISIIGPATLARHKVDELLPIIRRNSERTLVMLVPQSGSEAMAIEALRAGVDGYVKYPCPGEELSAELHRCIRKRDWLTTAGVPERSEMAGNGRAMQEITGYLSRVAQTESNVLITGETGTGKELAAQFVHARSRRAKLPFVTVNCAAIPDSLLESELFGYEKGAFTGAQAAQQGKLGAADRGTIFFDEIGDMSPYAQAKILRLTENKEIQKLGKAGTSPVNVRIVAATNQDLEALARDGRFRKDLFFRLNVGRVHLPPLRERKEDIPAIVSHYLQRMSLKVGYAQRIQEDAWACLLSYSWPGNIRELKNVLEMVLVNAPKAEITANDLPIAFRQERAEARTGDEEKQRILSALSATDWNKSKAAEKLNWSRMTLYRKMAKYHFGSSESQDLAGVTSLPARA
ncbi:MAG: sigma-54 dependent transcriptional regulator [Bryobacteraceae bacterium]